MLFPKPSENAFKHLAETDPDSLERWILSDKLSIAHLSFAVEALGKVPGNKFINTLISLLINSHPIVREGIVYALSYHLDNKNAIEQLRLISRHDTNKNVRKAALEILEE
jgi:HEAT repeat protein